MEHRNAAITGDVILFDRFHGRVLLIRRGGEPFKDCWALPGGFFNAYPSEEGPADLTPEAAAWRELKEEASVDAFGPDAKVRGYFKTFSDPDRDPRGRVVTFVYYAMVDREIEVVTKDDAKEYQWFYVSDIISEKVNMAFDHRDIIEQFFVPPFKG